MHSGKCVTVFPRDIEDEDDLVQAIREGSCRAAYLDDLVTMRDNSGKAR
jgi:hypothetical protein